MKVILLLLAAAFGTLCSAQGLGLNNLPDCAKPCAATLPAKCGISVQCICSDKDWITGISCCVKQKCPAADQQKTIEVAQQVCDTANVKLPTAAACPGDSSTSAGAGGSSSSTGTSQSSTSMGSSIMASTSGSDTATAMTGSSTMASTAASPTPASGAGNRCLVPGLGAGAAALGLALL